MEDRSLLSQIEAFSTRSLKHVDTYLTTSEGKKVSKMFHACIARVMSYYLHSSSSLSKDGMPLVL